MKKLIFPSLVLFFLLFLCSCFEDDQPTPQSSIPNEICLDEGSHPLEIDDPIFIEEDCDSSSR